MARKSERRSDLPEEDASKWLEASQRALEPGLTIGDVDVNFPDEPRLIAVATGHVAFERRGRGLVMIVEAREEPIPPETLHVRHSFRAVLRADDDGLVLDSLMLGPPYGGEDYFRAAFDERDGGITPAVLHAVRPPEIIAAVVQKIRASGEMSRQLAALNKDRWMLEGERGARLAKVIARIDAMPSRPRRRGRERVSADEVYRRVAALCVDEFNNGRRRGFHKLVQARFDVPPKTASDWIYKARAGEWLAPSAPGRINFAPGPRLIEERGEPNG